MGDFVGSYPWHWTAADADDFFGHLRGVRNLAHTTVRAYQTDVKLFLDYATDPAYDWNEHCGRLFGTVFSQLITEFNRARHVQADDARPLKRPFTPTELQQFFDLADLEPERILNAGRKGALAAWRDAVAFKTLYGWGLRRNEVRHLQLVDFSRNARAPFFGEWGLVRVRHGKAMRGSPAKQRTVLTVFDWAAEALADWAERGLPRYGQPFNDLFPTEKGGSGARAQSVAAHAPLCRRTGLPARAGSAFLPPCLCHQSSSRVRLRRQFRAAATWPRACCDHLHLHTGRTGLPGPRARTCPECDPGSQ
jgi:integrase